MIGRTMHRQLIPMKTVIDFYVDAESDDFELEFDGEDLYSSEDVLLYLQDNFYEYCYSCPDSVSHAAVTYFKNMWERFVSRRIADLYAAYKALYAEYDPISNYDMTEQSADGKRYGKNLVTTTPSGKASTTSSTDQAGLDSTGDGVQVNKNTVEQTFEDAKTETETTPTNDQSATCGDITLTDLNEAQEHTLRRTGNIGVTTSQQMITSELELRRHDLLAWFIKQFTDEYLVFVG